LAQAKAGKKEKKSRETEIQEKLKIEKKSKRDERMQHNGDAQGTNDGDTHEGTVGDGDTGGWLREASSLEQCAYCSLSCA
jgi:hypothetical protein